MKIIHIESGLGNQMLSYCEYIAIKKMNPLDVCCIENIIYEIPECNDIICQWNGYELKKIFGIDAPNLKDYFNEQQWNDVLQSIKKSEFWNRNWNYPVWFTKAFNENGLNVINRRGNFEDTKFVKKYSGKKSIKQILVDTFIGNKIKRIYMNINKEKYLNMCDSKNELFLKTTDNIFTGQRLSFKLLNNSIELIEEEIRNTFKFPEIQDDKNLKILSIINDTNSVAIHARRGDMLSYNGFCYKYGYFKRAVKYIKSNVKNPTFIFFCDPGSIEWCKENQHIFGLDFKVDKILFVDWNKGENSFRDMQLMSKCKHNIITTSSFGWWGAYLNENPNKITCSPDITINTTHHF